MELVQTFANSRVRKTMCKIVILVLSTSKMCKTGLQVAYCKSNPLCSGHSLLYPPHNEVDGVYIGFTLSVRPSVRLSVNPASRVCSVAPTVLDGSISYL